MMDERPPVNACDTSKDHFKKALNSAVRLLTRRDHSRYELVQKLQQRGFGGAVVDRVIAECRRLNYLDDERTAKVFIRQLHRRGYGRRRIHFELKQKGLRGKRIQAILAESIPEADEQECAERILHKNIERFAKEADLIKRKGKIYRFLNARGFSESIISEIMRNVNGLASG